jgi:hypothetical protein
MESITAISDPERILEGLSPASIQQELSELECRIRALRVLLRAANARRRKQVLNEDKVTDPRC